MKNKNVIKISKIIVFVSMILILLLSFILCIVDFSIKYIIFDILIIFIYFYLNKAEKEQLNNEKIKKENEDNDFTKIQKNLFVNEVENSIMINNTVYSFKDILNAELIEDGNSITTTTGKKKASVGKALVGGALFGSAGVIVGGNAGKVNSKSIETQYCTNLKVKISINKISNPCEFIKLIEYRTDKESSKYKKAYEDAQKILSVIELITSQNN